MEELHSGLNSDQVRAVTHQGSALLVLAGAGSGKTKVLTHRAAWLINSGKVEAKRIVLLTFTNKAAEEMRGRVLSLTQRGVGFSGTFHAFCARLLRIYGESIGVDRNFVIYDTDDGESVMKEAIKNMGLDVKKCRPRGVVGVISRMKNNLINLPQTEAIANTPWDRQVIGLWKEYERIKQQYKALDFDDLLVKSVEILRSERPGDLIRQLYGYVLVDEYQDTNKAQFELTKLLVSAPERLSVVGDASQAIYAFRGADFRNLILLKQFFPDITEVRLELNYRSSQNILDAAYGVINHNTGHPILRLKTNGDVGEKIDLYEANDERDEANYVVNKLLCDRGESAILYRTNAQSRVFEEELLRRGIAYKLVGGTRFYERAEIKDLVAYLRVVENESDGVSWRRIEKRGKRKMMVFRSWLVDHKKELLGLKPGEILEEILEVTKFKGDYDEQDEADRARLENIDEFRAVAGEGVEIGAFLENVALIQNEESVGQGGSTTPRITLMTIHAAKGLEFDRVQIVGLEEGLFPHSRSLLSKDDMEEERRLLYVAITRAKKQLGLSFSKSRLMFGGRNGNVPSRFLREIPEHTLNAVRISNVGDGFERRIVQDWEVNPRKINRELVDRLVAEDFEEIDNW